MEIFTNMNATSYGLTVLVELRASSRSHVTDDILELLTLLPINDRSSQVGFDNQSSSLLYVLLRSTVRRY